VSSIRIFLLAALEERGPMHGHQLRLLAEEEHVALWTDIAVTRVDPDHLDDLSAIITARIASLKAMLDEWEAHAAAIDRYLSVSERLVMKHRADRLRTEIGWHEDLSAALPEIIDDQRAGRKQ
jgi:hypothetical protein